MGTCWSKITQYLEIRQKKGMEVGEQKEKENRGNILCSIGKVLKTRDVPVEPGICKDKGREGTRNECLQANSRICMVPTLISFRSLLPTHPRQGLVKAWLGSFCEFLQHRSWVTGPQEQAQEWGGSILAPTSEHVKLWLHSLSPRLGVTGCGTVCCGLHNSASPARVIESTHQLQSVSSVY